MDNLLELSPHAGDRESKVMHGTMASPTVPFEIHLDWDGPFTLDEAKTLHGKMDRWLYQYYGDHPVYGQNTLIYLGIAAGQTLGARIRQHNWHEWCSAPVQLYVGRLCSAAQLNDQEAKRQIELAERILLFSHSPAFNTANLNSIGHKGSDVRVLNWGKRKLLLPEVTISRWERAIAGHGAPPNFQKHTFDSNEAMPPQSCDGAQRSCPAPQS